jgi:hypothetical protein
MKGITNMKTRTLAFAFALCFASSLALADNPSDAQLSIDAGFASVQQDEQARSTDHHRQKKQMKASKNMAKESVKPEPKAAPRTSSVPAKTNTTSAL